MEVVKIYFDMDGVLADFERGIREICGMEPIHQNGEASPEKEDEMWRRVKEAGHFYDMLELMPGAKEMFDAVYNIYGDRCEILTGIPKPKRGIESAGDDKISWMRRKLSKDIKINIVYRRDKVSFCKGKEYILIDDYEKSIREWNETGGIGILHKDSERTFELLKEIGVIS